MRRRSSSKARIKRRWKTAEHSENLLASIVTGLFGGLQIITVNWNSAEGVLPMKETVWGNGMQFIAQA
jgi:hypothetical protein